MKAGKKKGRSPTRRGNRYLARILAETAMIAGRTDSFLGERYRRRANRQAEGDDRGRPLHAGDHLASDVRPETRYSDLGPDFYDKRIKVDCRKRNHIHQLEALGYKVTVEPAA